MSALAFKTEFDRGHTSNCLNAANVSSIELSMRAVAAAALGFIQEVNEGPELGVSCTRKQFEVMELLVMDATGQGAISRRVQLVIASSVTSRSLSSSYTDVLLDLQAVLPEHVDEYTQLEITFTLHTYNR